MSGEVIQVVTQRTTRWRMMVNEGTDEWVESSGPGLVIYLSFVNNTLDNGVGPIDCTRISRAVKSLMNAKLATTSGWKTDHSDAVSISSLVETNEPTHLVIIPQATLSGRLNPGDKYLKYHRQVDRVRSYQLYCDFIRGIAEYMKSNEGIDFSSNTHRIGDSLAVSWGSFGKRQGFEFASSGPSTHYFEF